MEKKFDFAYGSGSIPLSVKAGQIDVIESVTPEPIADLKEAFRAAVEAVLTDQEREVVCMRYGLFGRQAQKQREVAARLGISRSYVSRIEKRALERLRAELEEPVNS